MKVTYKREDNLIAAVDWKREDNLIAAVDWVGFFVQIFKIQIFSNPIMAPQAQPQGAVTWDLLYCEFFQNFVQYLVYQ